MGEVLRPTRKPNCKGMRVRICRECGMLREVNWNSTKCPRCTKETRRIRLERERMKRALPFYLKTD